MIEQSYLRVEPYCSALQHCCRFARSFSTRYADVWAAIPTRVVHRSGVCPSTRSTTIKRHALQRCGRAAVAAVLLATSLCSRTPCNILLTRGDVPNSQTAFARRLFLSVYLTRVFQVSMAYHPTNMTISLLPVISEDGRELHWDHQAACASYVMDIDQVGR